MGNRAWFIADLHLGHQLMVKNFTRPFTNIEEHDATLIQNINSCVKKNDTLYLLGDLVLGSRAAGIKKLKMLNGIKRAVLGNHDRFTPTELAEIFRSVHGCYEISKRIMLSHIPIHPYQLEHRFKLNIHGHMHSHKMDNPKYFCVSAEQTNYFPISREELMEKWQANMAEWEL